MIDDQWLSAQLKARGLVSQAQLDVATRSQPGDLCQGLVATGAVPEPELLKFLGLYFQTRYVTTEKLSAAKIPQWVMELVPLELCERFLAIPVRCEKERSELSIVCTDPSSTELHDAIRNASGMATLHAYVALRHAVEAAIRRAYRGDIHAFARIDQSLRQNYSELMNIYEQRLIDFDQDAAAASGPAGADLGLELPDTRAPFEVTHEPAAMDLAPGVSPAAAAPASHAGSDSLESLSRAPRQTSLAPPVGGGRTLQADGFIQIVGVLTNLIESGDGWRQGHSVELARLALQIGERMGVSGTDLQQLRLASILHDLGKPAEPHLTVLGIEASAENRTLARKLYSTPSKLLETAQLPAELDVTLQSLYERPDGTGVPGRRHGRDLPLAARIIAAVDAFCDLTANPRAPGGRIDDPELATQRLREAVQRQLLDGDVISVLSQVVGETHRQRVKGHRVLVIDAEVGSTTVLEQKLTAIGYEVRVVRTTAEAALVVLSEKVSLILSEVRLDPVDGFVFLERLRSDPRTQALPFMFISDRAEVEDVNRGFELGALDYIVKPFAPEVLVAKIRRVLDQPAGRR